MRAKGAHGDDESAEQPADPLNANEQEAKASCKINQGKQMEFNATFLVSAISFIVFTILMNMIFYKPLTKVMTERQNFLDDTYNEARKSREGAAQILKDRETKLNQSAEELKKLLNQKLNDTSADAKKKTLRAKNNSNKKIEAAKSELADETLSTQKELNNEIETLAQNIVAKVLDEAEFEQGILS